MRDVVNSGARVMATQMARTAQPFGTGESARIKGERAVIRDIARVYATPGRAYADITNFRGKAAFWKAIKAKDFSVAELLLQEFGKELAGVPVRSFDGGAAHTNARNPRGRVNQRRPTMIVTNRNALDSYRAQEIKRVGTGKGGFADIVRRLGTAPRGLRTEGDITANWITRNGRGFGAAYLGGNDKNPSIRIQNRLPYATNILSGTALSEAKFIARQRMIANLESRIKREKVLAQNI
jgi:hypothetical protein